MIHARPIMALLFLSAVTAAQEPTFTVVPDSAPPATPRTITVRAPANTAISMQFTACHFSTVHSGGPNGPVVPVPLSLCNPAGLTLQPCQSNTHNISSFTVGNLVAGTYWLKCTWAPLGGQSQISWVDIRVENPLNEATLTAPQPQVGQIWPITLSHPSDPTAAYFAAASFTTNVGIPAGPFFISLDNDFLFNLSFPTPNTSLFANFQGGLDAAGQATLFMVIPPVPQLSCFGLHVQAVLFSGAAPPVVTNCLDDSIL